MSVNGNAQTRPVTVGFAGLDYGKKEDQIPVISPAVEYAYKVPPVVWMVVFLLGGYLGIRWIMED